MLPPLGAPLFAALFAVTLIALFGLQRGGPLGPLFQDQPSHILPPFPAPPQPTPLPGAPALHPMLRGSKCAYLVLSPLTRLEFCPFSRLRIYKAFAANWEQFSTLGTEEDWGSFSASASGGGREGTQQVFDGGDPCSDPTANDGRGKCGATVDFECPLPTSEPREAAAGGVGVRLVKEEAIGPCARRFLLATPLAC